MERDNAFLHRRLTQIWTFLFPEVPKSNDVKIRFKGKWKNKFGHIQLLRDKSTEIVVNGFFKNEIIPEFIIDLTIAHELVHYMHGFQSPLPQQFRYPHQGNIVDKELNQRGFGHILAKEKLWLKNAWPDIVKKHFVPRKRRLFRLF
jgi:hypothetical protein